MFVWSSLSVTVCLFQAEKESIALPLCVGQASQLLPLSVVAVVLSFFFGFFFFLFFYIFMIEIVFLDVYLMFLMLLYFMKLEH